MLRLSYFLCCLQLETGVILIGITHLACCAIAAFICSAILIACMFVDCSALIDYDDKQQDWTEWSCDVGPKSERLKLRRIAILI